MKNLINTQVLTVDITTPEEIQKNLENYEEISYLSKLYSIPEYQIKKLIKQGYSTNQLDKVWEICYTL